MAPRYGLIGINVRTVLDLLHGQSNGELAPRLIEMAQHGHGQKNFATGKPLAGIDHQPTNQPAGVVE